MNQKIQKLTIWYKTWVKKSISSLHITQRLVLISILILTPVTLGRTIQSLLMWMSRRLWMRIVSWSCDPYMWIWNLFSAWGSQYRLTSFFLEFPRSKHLIIMGWPAGSWDIGGIGLPYPATFLGINNYNGFYRSISFNMTHLLIKMSTFGPFLLNVNKFILISPFMV